MFLRYLFHFVTFLVRGFGLLKYGQVRGVNFLRFLSFLKFMQISFALIGEIGMFCESYPIL